MLLEENVQHIELEYLKTSIKVLLIKSQPVMLKHPKTRSGGKLFMVYGSKL